MKKLLLALLTIAIALLLAGVFAQAQDNAAKSGAQSAGQATQDAGKAAEGTQKGVDTVTDKIDINSASSDQLQKLSGIGPATAAKIIAGRPYNSKRDLLTRKVVSQKEYDAISDKIVAHKATQ